jgi:hypothetical protein
VGIEAALAAVAVLHRLLGLLFAGADRADDVHAFLAAQHLPLDEETFLAVRVHDHPRGAVSVARVDVLVPHVQRLEHVPISVDDVVRASHGKPPLSIR